MDPPPDVTVVALPTAELRTSTTPPVVEPPELSAVEPLLVEVSPVEPPEDPPLVAELAVSSTVETTSSTVSVTVSVAPVTVSVGSGNCAAAGAPITSHAASVNPRHAVRLTSQPPWS